MLKKKYPGVERSPIRNKTHCKITLIALETSPIMALKPQNRELLGGRICTCVDLRASSIAQVLSACGFECYFQVFFIFLLSLLLCTEIKIRLSLTREKPLTYKKVVVSSRFSHGWQDSLLIADTGCDMLFLEPVWLPHNSASEVVAIGFTSRMLPWRPRVSTEQKVRHFLHATSPKSGFLCCTGISSSQGCPMFRHVKSQEYWVLI